MKINIDDHQCMKYNHIDLRICVYTYCEVIVLAGYLTESIVFKVLSEPIRLQILDVLSCGEFCACDLLKNLSISQPTLSHHMKALIESGLINAQKRATWMYYSINYESVQKLQQYIDALTMPKEECLCRISCPESCE